MHSLIRTVFHHSSVLVLRIKEWPWLRISEWCVLGFLILAVLWRGGKSLDATWMLVGVSWLCTVVWWWKERKDMRPETSDMGEKTSLFLWSCVIAMMVWTVVSYRYSTAQNYGLDEVLRTGAFGLLFLWFIRVFSNENHAQVSCLKSRLFQIITFVTLLACVIGLFIYVLQPVNRFVGTFFDYRFHTDYWPNAWAEYVLLVWPIVLLYLWKPLCSKEPRTPTCHGEPCRIHTCRSAGLLIMTQRIWQDNKRIFICLSIFGFLIGCLFLSYSRGAMIAFWGQLIVWFFLFYPPSLILPRWGRCSSRENEDMIIPWKTIATNAGIVLGTALVVFFVANILRGSRFDIEDPWDKVTFDSAEGSSSVSERAMFWRQATSLAWQRPLFGWGPYSFRFVQPHVQEGVLTTSDHPHNVFLKLAMEQGWIAAILFGVVVGFVLWKGFRRVIQLSSALGGLLPADSGEYSVLSSEQKDIVILLLLSICGVIAHNLIDYNLQFVGIALPFWIILALLYSHSSLSTPYPLSTTPRLIRGIEITIATVLLLIALFEGRFLLVSSLGRHAEARSESERALFWYDAAEGEWFSRDLHLSRIQLLLNKGALPEASIAISDYIKVNEEDHRIWKSKGDFHLQRKEFDEALEAYERAYLHGKYSDLSPMLGIIDVSLKTQEWFALKNRLPEFKKLLGEYVDAIEKNTHFIALSDTVENFLAIVDRLEKAFPEDGPQYQVMGARVDRHAKLERARFHARPLGRLW